ncbi:hypothetical protein [Nocardioides sp. TF02-7]|uniref:hypothetical protein n=1 Tax=Nocardioides sp. TF02-7 TaxID=2917724 RepID=UPI001F051B59|nr:hypothetical protein [Nocardioides sp. TF02-7]UMG91003.1 hypothetical protein MF408_12235 [Nocardioides sp. TF02-7]
MPARPAETPTRPADLRALARRGLLTAVVATVVVALLAAFDPGGSPPRSATTSGRSRRDPTR